MFRLLAVFGGLTIGLLVAVPLGAAPVPKHLMPKDPPLTFPTQVGTTWVYEGGYGKRTIVITKVEEKSGAKLVTTEEGQEGKRGPHMVMLINEKGAYIVGESGTDYDKPWCLIKFPHHEGDTWEEQVTGRGFDFLSVMKAGPFEKVKVPFGELTAARVEWNGLGGKESQTKTSYWYADGIGLVRLGDGMKLKSFTPGKE